MGEPAKRLYTVQEAADVLSLSRMSVYRLMSTGQLAAKKLGKRTVIPAESLDALISGLPSAQLADYDK